jgi:hypothetical protein
LFWITLFPTGNLKCKKITRHDVDGVGMANTGSQSSGYDRGLRPQPRAKRESGHRLDERKRERI